MFLGKGWCQIYSRVLIAYIFFFFIWTGPTSSNTFLLWLFEFSWNTRYLKKVPILCISMTIMIFKPPNVCKVCPHAPQEGSYIIINYLPSVWVHARILRTPLGDTNHKWPQDGSFDVPKPNHAMSLIFNSSLSCHGLPKLSCPHMSSNAHIPLAMSSTFSFNVHLLGLQHHQQDYFNIFSKVVASMTSRPCWHQWQFHQHTPWNYFFYHVSWV